MLPRLTGLLALMLALSGCAGGARSNAPEVVGTIARDLAVPWGIAFLPDGSALVTERDRGRVLWLRQTAGRWQVRTAGRVAATSVRGGESGLLGIAVSPDFARDRRVFVYATGPDSNRVLRGRFAEGRLGALHQILGDIPSAAIHDGGRIAFGPDGYLYVSTGESGRPELAQDLRSLGGKILRITQDGRPAPGNPDFGGRPHRGEIWSYGHRNVQGLAWDPAGRMWASEFGQDRYDELNLIVRGGDYGWPLVEGRGHAEGMRNPLVTWSTDEASPSGLAYAAGSLWLGALRGERLWQVPVHGSSTGEPRSWFIGRYGRLRTVVPAPDGNLWLTTSNHDGRGSPGPQDDRILVVRP